MNGSLIHKRNHDQVKRSSIKRNISQIKLKLGVKKLKDQDEVDQLKERELRRRKIREFRKWNNSLRLLEDKSEFLYQSKF